MRFRVTATIVLAAAIAVSAAVAARQAGPRATRITMAEFKVLHQKDEVVAVDVRDPESYAEGHIPGALLVPLDALPRYLEKLAALKKPIVTYCA